MSAKCALILLISATAFLFSGCAEAILGCKDGDPLLFFSPVRDFACPEEPADAVDNVQIVPTEGNPNQVVLEWNNPAQTDLRAIEIRWTTVANSASPPRAITNAEGAIDTTADSNANGVVRIPNARPNERMQQKVTVQPGFAYRFRIASVDSHNNVSLVQQTQYITAPVGVRTQIITEGTRRVRLTWMAIQGADEYYVERLGGGNNAFTRQASDTSIRSASYEDSAIAVGATYTYRIRAVIKDGTSIIESGESDTVQTTIGGVTPTGITINPGYQRVTLSWNTVEGATKYHIYRATGTNGMFDLNAPPHAVVTPEAGTTQMHVDTARLLDNVIYKYRIGTVESNIEGPLSTEMVVQVAPASPTNLVAEGRNNAVDLRWQLSIGGASRYHIYRAAGDSISGATRLENTVPAMITGATYTDSTAINGTKYTYAVRAVNAEGAESSNSNTETVTPFLPDTTAPTFGTPTFANPTARGGTVTIPGISEAGTIYWVVYSDGAPVPASAAALRTAASGSIGGNVVAVSGSGTAIGTGDQTVSLTTLDDGVRYDFYAAIGDAAGNLSARSAKLDLTTMDVTAPTFGTPTFADPTESGGTVTIPGISEAGTLYWVVYTDGAPAPANATALRTAATGSTGGNVVAVSGSGTAVSTRNHTVSLTTLAVNTSYDFYAAIIDATGNLSTRSAKLDFATLDNTAPTFGTPTFANPTASGGTVTIPNISEAGTLFWVVYTDGATAPVSAAALRTVATGSTGGNVVAVSGSSAAIGTGNQTIALTTLAANTSYDFYAVIGDAAGNLSLLSPKLNFTNRDATMDFNTLDAAGNDDSYSIWSDGITMWALDREDKKIYAYNASTKMRDATKDFDTLDAAGNDDPRGIWSDGITMWVVDWTDGKIYAYNASTKMRDATKDFDTLDAGNDDPQGIWSDGTTMWVADWTDSKIYAYTLSDKTRDGTKDFDTLDAAGNDAATGIWSDGTTMWVADWEGSKIYAYTLSDKTRDAAKDFNTLGTFNNDTPYGVWSDGTTMWVADPRDQKIYAYYTHSGTALNFAYSCPNGTPSAGTTPNYYQINCQSCSTGYTLSNNMCVQNAGG